MECIQSVCRLHQLTGEHLPDEVHEESMEAVQTLPEDAGRFAGGAV